MKRDKKLSALNMAVQNLKAKKSRTLFMMFFVVLMAATVFFSTILMENMRQGIKSTTERAGADIIVVPDEGTEDIRDSLFAGKPCSVFFDRSMKEAVEQVEGVERVSGQMYVGTLSASCCSLPVQMIAFDPETDFVVQPWLKNQNAVRLEKGQVLVEGMVPVTDDSGEVVRTLFVRADADIRLRTTKTYREQVSRFQRVRSYTGKKRQGVRLRIGSMDILAMLPLTGKQNWELTGVSRQTVLFEDFFLPVWTEMITAREYENVERKRTKTELNTLTKAVHERKLQKLTEKGVQIIENDVKILDNSTGWTICGSMIVEESAGIGQKLESFTGRNFLN